MASRLYNTGVHHPNRGVRILGMGLLFMACVCRAGALFAREVLLLLAALLLVARASGCSLLLLLVLAVAAVYAWCCLRAAQRVEYVAGHRAGAKGYSGQYCENTIEAMQALVAEDNGPNGPLPDLHYVEIDVQETADGELVVLHDFHLGEAFPDTGPNTQPYQQLRNGGLPPASASAQKGLRLKDVTAAQLRSLHLAGRRGLHAPTLAAFLAAFRAAQCRRPLVVEVKGLQTDAAREELLQLLRSHQPYAAECARRHPQLANPQLGFLAVIAFPNHYAASFGEFGGAACRRWDAALAALRIPVRCCFLEELSYLRSIPGAV